MRFIRYTVVILKTYFRIIFYLFIFVASILRAQVPTITSFSPASASAGSTVTISGTNFNSTAANNIVYFGAGKGTVTTASSTSLSVTVPINATYGTISVTVIGINKTAISKNFFTPSFSAGDLDASSLTVDQTINLTGTPLRPLMIDMNNDGKLDLLFTRSFSSPLETRTISYLQNTSSSGNFSFASKIEIPTPSVPRKNYFGTEDNRPTDPKKIIPADFDGDGVTDFVVVTQYGVSVQRNIGFPGTPSFQHWQEFLNPDMTGGSWQMIKGTIHNALIGALFTALGGRGAGRAKAMGGSLPFNGGAGSMPNGFPDNHSVWVPDYLSNMNANDAVVADFNNDGKPDIAIVYSGNPAIDVHGRLCVFINNGSSFSLATDLEILDPVFQNQLDIYSIAAADFDGNDTTDIVVAGNFNAYSHQGMVTVLVNAMGDGTSFLPIRNWPVDSRAERVVVADFDGDAKPDIAYQVQDLNKILVRRNTSPSDDLTFSDPIEISFPNAYNSMQVSDIDGDGKPDLVWGCEGASGFKIARNTGSSGTISFASPIHYLTSITFPNVIAVGDLNGDGKPDIVSVKSPDEISILKNSILPYSLSQSLVNVTTPSIAKNATTPVALQLKDKSGNSVNVSGQTVLFSLAGSGTSSGTFGSVSDDGGGAYSATFTGTNVGTAKNVTASVGGTQITSTLPTVTVAGGSNSVAHSTVSISRPIVAAGATATVTFYARDVNNDTLTTGGLSGVTFFLNGSGTSSGSFGSVTDNGSGTYSTTFTASTAGTAKNISARIGTDTIQTSLPTVTVITGTFSTSNSVLSVASSSILKYDTTTVTLQVKDGSGNNITTGGLNVKIEIFGSVNPMNNGKAYLTDVVDNQNGTYSCKLIGLTVSTGTAVISSIYNSGTSSYQQVNSFPSTVSVTARPVSLSLSTIDVLATNGKTVPSSTIYFYLYLKNDKGEAYTATCSSDLFSLLSDGTSAGSATTSVTNAGGGTYYMGWQGTTPGTARTVTATIDGNSVTSSLPTITVVPFGPGITYPGFGEQAVPVDTIFYWGASSGATSYRVQVVADSLNGTALIDTSGVTGTSLSVSGLQNYRVHFVRVMAMNSGIESNIWAERQFTTILPDVMPLYPPDRESNTSSPVPFSWASTNGASTFRFQIATDTGFVSLVTDEDTITQTIDTVKGLVAGTKYFWRVKAAGGGGTSSFSPTFSFTTSTSQNGASIYYVKAIGDDNASGTSWANAFATVTKALSVASAGTQIWVASGTYKPTATTDRSISFELKNGVALYGGFSGTETNLSQRNGQTNVTILSGDIDGDATLAGNSYHVVNASNTFASSVLDGFTITGGNADGWQRGGGIYCSTGYPILSNLTISNSYANDIGGGMYNVLGNPTLTNVTFTSNTSGDKGGGMYNERGKPVFINCSFIGNSAIDGGGVWNGNYNYPNTSNADFTNVMFKNNSSSHFGGGMYTEYSNPTFRNILFHNNSSGAGGGIYATQGTITVANTTFSNNAASGSVPTSGGGVYSWQATIDFKNTIFWGNTNNQVFNGMGSSSRFYNSLVQNGMPSAGGFGVDNAYGGFDADSGGNVYADPLFVNAASGDVRISTGSPAIDAGDNSLVTAISDIGGYPRIIGKKVDMGAFEYQSANDATGNSVTSNDSLYQFGNTKVNLNFSGIAPGKKVIAFASHYLTSPDSIGFTGTAPSFVSSFRWIIAQTGDVFSSASIVLSDVSTYPGVSDPSTLSIYHRSTPGSGNFSPLTTTYDAVTDKLTATTTTFSEFVIGSDNNALPVELFNLTVTANRLNAELKWKTATEANNYGFEIERAAISALPLANSQQLNAKSWFKAGFIEGNGTINSPKQYSFTDRNLKVGKYSYRLKQIDRDGKFKYTQAIEVQVGTVPKVFALEQNYPNPFNPTTTIGFTIQTTGLTTMKIYDVIGREAATLVNENLEAGVYHQYTFDASKLSSGIYFARLQSGDKVQLKKMLLIK